MRVQIPAPYPFAPCDPSSCNAYHRDPRAPQLHHDVADGFGGLQRLGAPLLNRHSHRLEGGETHARDWISAADDVHARLETSTCLANKEKWDAVDCVGAGEVGLGRGVDKG